MKLKVLILLSASFLSLASLSKSGKKQTAEEIVRLADEARYPRGSLSFHVRVTDLEGDKQTNETLYLVHTKDHSKTLVETKEPARLSGRKLLMQEDELWLYLPDLKRPTRIGFEQRLTGEVSNGDLARTDFSSDYRPKLLGVENVGQRACYKLLLVAKKKTTPYRKIMYWIEKATYYPVKIGFYAISGKLLKVGEYSDPQLVLGKKRVSRLTISDAVQTHRQSRLTYSNFKKDTFDDSFFNKESISDE